MAKPQPRKMGHLVLHVRDIRKSFEFYTEVVGLTLSDWIEDKLVFLRCGADHHDLALVQIPPDAENREDLYRVNRPGLEHFAYELGSLEEIEAAARHIQSMGVKIERGIGKHGPGENLFLVFKDPDNNNVEFYADMVQVTEEAPYDPSVWKDDVTAFDQWKFEKFLVEPPKGWGEN
ncbi:VOC family protein [Stappia sp. MMSF_3263]|jgi:catechol 2,3-dioxygenase|uniref:VOC family protein n=1 Tax=Stappia sp. MMSF_3263 TaxID=3046693 RepID=UPI00273E6919|nr:VOC family protein [Stappia sp. MMSF_3263]